MDLLKGQLKSASSLADYTNKQEQNHIISTDLMTKAQRWWSPRSHFFKYAIRTADYGTRNREDMRFCRTRIYGAVKDIYGEIGLQLHKLELIEHTNEKFLNGCDNPNFCFYHLHGSKRLVHPHGKVSRLVERDQQNSCCEECCGQSTIV